MHRRSLLKSQKYLRCRTGDSFCRKASSSSLATSKEEKSRRVKNRQVQNAKLVAFDLVDRLANKPQGWKYTHRHTEKETIRTSLLYTTNERAPTMEKANFDMINAEAEPPESEPPTDTLLPGTFVETRRNLMCNHGVILHETTILAKKRYCVLMSSGEIWWPARQDIQFIIPDVVSQEMTERCGSADQSLTNVQHEVDARIEVLKRIRDIEKIMEPAVHTASRKSRNLYEDVKSDNPNTWETITVFEAAQLTNPNYDIYHVFATHKYMMSNNVYFAAGPEYSANHIFYVRPKSQVDDILQIQAWLRMQNGPMQSFVQRAKDVVKLNNALHKKSWNEEPSHHAASHTWTAEDLTILRFLKDSVRRTRSTQADPYTLGQSAIIKSIYPKKERIDENAVHQTLIDLGVFAPWQDLTMLFPELDVDIEPEETSPIVKRRNELVEIGLQKISGNDILGPHDFHRTDPLDAVRHDFGDLPVYVIDDATAEELDDGLSIERIPSEPNNLWVHVHIADPASLLPPTHYLAQQASNKMETVYLNHRSWAMFPKALMLDPHQGLSLGARKEKPTNVLTFSAKLNPEGDMLDYKVRAGLIRNTQVFTYEQVDAAIGATFNPGWYPFGGEPPAPATPPIAACHLSLLRDLFKAASFGENRRQRDGVYAISSPSINFHNPSRQAIESTVPTLEPTQFRGFPKISYQVWNTVDASSGSRAVVAEMAKVASRVASRFCLDKGLPAIRRFMMSPPPFAELEALLEKRYPNNYVPYGEPLSLRVTQMLAGYSLEPLEHFVLGVPRGEGYIRATSPLRRYIDLVHHWQIHHGLLGHLAPKRRPPFSAESLAHLIPKISESSLRSVTKFHNRFWQVMVMHRYLEGMKNGDQHEVNPMRDLRAIIMSQPVSNPVTTKYVAEAFVTRLGMTGRVSLDHSNVEPGSELAVKLDKYSLGTRFQIDFLPA